MAALDLYSQLAGMAPDVSRMRAQAQALRQRAAQVPQGQMVGQYFAAPPMTSQIANLGERILGGVMDRRASRTDEEYRNQLAQALRSPEGLSSIAETNPYAQNLMLMQQLEGAAQPDWQRVEVPTQQGMQIGFVDMNSPTPEQTFRPMGMAAPEAPGKLVQDESGQWVPNPAYLQMEREIAEAGKTSVNVNTGDQGPQFGTIPQGYMLVGDDMGYTMEPVPGGPAFREIEDKAEQDIGKQELKERYGDVVLEDIGRIEGIVEKAKIPVTSFGSYLSGIPGTPARDVRGMVDTIKANVGFDRLQQMRDASPTGGALGQVSELENRLLQSTLGNLEQSQSGDQFMYNLRRLKKIYSGIIHGVKDEGGVRTINELDVAPDPSFGDLLDKYAPIE